ncbi:hypothetical protein FRB94_000072 [Tulasnella sp. JGI-2019a]|nr:hypothetical protein FRB94_000072 [Tulasnella sp. JGI-2019a]KAG9015757.1 hypothetical protein FRB93_012322 [Tulasnella sp. JGI-2019a]KAG9039612.1 hypothetical protein FRB95_009192 [Tulasnella sp. JGI-2019a]
MTSQPIHGNYSGYYTKRPSIADLRIASLPENLFRNKTVLDVGCNEGWVSMEIAQRYGARRVIGVDIDETLIRNAWKRRKIVWSLQNSELTSKSRDDRHPHVKRRELGRHEDGIVPEAIDHSADSLMSLREAHYFPASLSFSFGTLPLSTVGAEDPVAFPHNVTFRTANWVASSGIPEDSGGYDVILALSITKWIHLNDGDEGILAFFKRVFETLRPGGKFILEPQSWDGYAKAKRMDPRLKETAAGIKLRPEDFGKLLQEFGFSIAERLGPIGEGGFRRDVDIFMKPARDGDSTCQT